MFERVIYCGIWLHIVSECFIVFNSVLLCLILSMNIILMRYIVFHSLLWCFKELCFVAYGFTLFQSVS